MDNEPQIPRRLPSSIRSRTAAAFSLAAGVFVALCLVVSPVNLPAHSAIAAVAIDDVPGVTERHAVTATRSGRRTARDGARRVSRRLGVRFGRRLGLEVTWAPCRTGWTAFSGVPPPRRRGPPLLA